MAGSARLQSLPTTALRGRQAWSILITLNPTKIARMRPPQPFTTCKWTRVGGPPNPSRLRVGGPPTLHDLQMDKGWGTLHDLQMDKGWGPPQPFTTCKWTRVGGPPNPSRLAHGQGLGAPQTLHDLQMDKGWGPPQPFTTCNWTRVGGPPNPSRLANGQGLGALQPLTTWGGRAPNPSRLEAAGPPNPSPKIGKAVTGPFGPDLPPSAKLKFCSWCNVGLCLAAYGSAGWMVCLAVRSIWVVLGWAFLHTKRSADQCYTLNPKP